MLQAMGAGSIDFGSVGDAPPVFAEAGGNKIDIVGALKSDPRAAVLLVPKGSPIHSIAEAALADPAKTTAIRDLLTLLHQAHTWADSHAAAWAAVWAQGTGLPASIMLNAAKDAASVPVPITAAVVTSEQPVSDAFTAAGLIPGHVNFSDFVDTRFNSVRDLNLLNR